MLLTSNIRDWHQTFDASLAPRKISDYSNSLLFNDKPVSLKNQALNWGQAFSAAFNYDAKHFEMAESWLYPSLLIYSIKLNNGEIKRILVSPSNRIAYDPHPFWLNALGLLNHRFEAFDLLTLKQRTTCYYQLNNQIISTAQVNEMYISNRISIASFGSFNYSHFLIDTIAEFSINTAIANLVDYKIFDQPSWAEPLCKRLGITRIGNSESPWNITILAVKNLIMCHIPSYQRRGELARRLFERSSKVSLNKANGNFIDCCFLARAKGERSRIINQPELIKWCINNGISVKYPSRMTISQKQRDLSRFSFFISDGGSTINNVLLFAHRLKGCLSIVPDTFLNSPYHCLGGMQYLNAIRDSLELDVYPSSRTFVQSGPVDSVHVVVEQLESRLNKMMSSVHK